jgi:hypothetical protein
MGVSVSVGGARVGAGVSEETIAGGATVFVAATGAGAFEGSVQAVSRKIRARDIVIKFFIAIYL